MATTIAAAWAQETTGGLFTTRNGGYEGRLGLAHFFVDTTRGGELALVSGTWPNLQRLVHTGTVATVRRGDDERIVRQAHDHSPLVEVLEEGHHRLGIRVRYALYDAANQYYGHGLLEAWAYPNGAVWLAQAISFETLSPYGALADGKRVDDSKAASRLAATVPASGPWQDEVLSAAVELTGGKGLAAALPEQGARVPFAPHQVLDLPGANGQPYRLTWRTGKLEYRDILPRPEGGSPTYYRWPIYLPQAHWGHAPATCRAADERTLALEWLPAARPPAANPDGVFLCRLAPAGTVPDEREPLPLQLSGGEGLGKPTCYNDLEGAYTIRKTADPLVVTIPADLPGRRCTLKIIGLSGHGAVVATLDGQPIVPQLVSQGGIADDPLAPIEETPEGPADLAVVTFAHRDQPQRFELREVPGVQLTYQSRDRQRHLRLFGTRTGPRHSLFGVSLANGRMRNLRAWGQRDWALTEHFLHCFQYCGFTPDQMLDSPVAAAILANGPDEVRLRFTGTNRSGDATSTFDLALRGDDPAPIFRFNARFEVTRRWPYPAVQFSDFFPFRGVDPADWWYQEACYLAPDGKVKWENLLTRRSTGDQPLSDFPDGGFFALTASDRGNVLMLVRPATPPLNNHSVICGNYVDWHMDLQFRDAQGKLAPPAAGTVVSVPFEIALWGDAKITREQLLAIGRESLAAGRLVLPR